MLRFKSVLFATSSLLLAGVPAVHAAAAVQLAAHRAVYDVDLKDVSERSGIDGMRGRIVYEFRGSPCDGYTTNFRFVTQILAHGTNRINDQQTSSYEDGEGEMFRFVTKTFVDEKLDKEVEGTATHGDAGTVVDIKKPEEARYDLASALFPTQHIIDMINRAKSGETFYEEQIFDGSDLADTVMSTTVVIGPEKTTDDDNADAIGELKDVPFRNVSVAYFDEQNEGEGLPEYRISFKLLDNGVTRALEMDYGDFVLQGDMTEFEYLPQEPCN